MSYTRGRFQSTPPVKGVTSHGWDAYHMDGISIHTPCEGGDIIRNQRWQISQGISIHTPCEGGDENRLRLYSQCRNISIHTPCEGGDFATICYRGLRISAFQSTPPVKGVTRRHNLYERIRMISIHTPCEGGDDTYVLTGCPSGGISIHTPCEGGDPIKIIFAVDRQISIHTPCEGRTRDLWTLTCFK